VVGGKDIRKSLHPWVKSMALHSCENCIEHPYSEAVTHNGVVTLAQSPLLAGVPPTTTAFSCCKVSVVKEHAPDESGM